MKILKYFYKVTFYNLTHAVTYIYFHFHAKTRMTKFRSERS